MVGWFVLSLSLVLSGNGIVDSAQVRRVPPEVHPVLHPLHVEDDLSNVVNLYDFVFTDEQKSRIARDHFLIYDGAVINPTSIYRETPVPFITTDMMLHIYHVLLSNSIEEAERVILEPRLRIVIEEMGRSMEAHYREGSAEVRAAARKNLFLLGVAAALLGGRFSLDEELTQEVDGMVKRITSFQAVTFDGRYIDPTLFKVRAGYTPYRSSREKGFSWREEHRANYFRTVVWLGQAGLRLDDPTSVRAVALLAQAFNDNPRLTQAYRSYMHFVRFLAGREDGLSLETVAAIARNELGQDFSACHLSEARLASFGEVLKKFSQAAILNRLEAEGIGVSDAPKLFLLLPGQYSLTGQLFQMILEQGTGSQRVLPSGMDCAHVVLGSPLAAEMSPIAGKASFEAMTERLNRRSESHWYQSVDGGILYALRALVKPAPEGYPHFMRTTAWERKSLNTALCGWVHVSHDLFLYQKHAYYYLDGGGGWTRFSGYVEPNPEFYSRLAHSVSLVLGQLRESSLFRKLRQEKEKETHLRMTDPDKQRPAEFAYAKEEDYVKLRELLEKLAELSRKELESEAFTEEDHEFMEGFGQTCRLLTFDVGGAPADNEDYSIVCDLATEVLSGECLHVGIGRPLVLVCLVPWAGQPHLAKGAILTYHEFTTPISQRLDDLDWKRAWDRDRRGWLFVKRGQRSPSQGNAAHETFQVDHKSSWLAQQGMLDDELLEIHDPEALRHYLLDENPRMRASVADRLVRLGALEVLPEILELIHDHSKIPENVPGRQHPHGDTTVSKAVAYFLRKTKDTMGVEGERLLTESILNAKDDSDPRTRLSALGMIYGLGDAARGHPEIEAYVRQAATSNDEAMRGRAEQLLRKYWRKKE